MSMQSPAIDAARSADRIDRDIEALSGPDYSTTGEAIRRYAYTSVYRNTLDYFTCAFEELGFEVYEDAVGTLVARNRPRGEPVFGLGSHCDSNRNGGKYDGTLGVVCALEVCRLSAELGLDLPLQLESFTAIDDGRPFFEHARDAGYEPERWAECLEVLEDLTGWIELHIEQGRVLQDTQNRIGVVNAIAGYVHGDIWVDGRADHAGATPMGFRVDAGAVAAEIILELERLASNAGNGTVGTAGEIEFSPSLINVVPSGARISLDIRGVDENSYRGVARDIAAFAEQAAARRGAKARFVQRQFMPPTPMDGQIVAALTRAAEATGEPFIAMPSGAAHDTMCVADHKPTAMVFVPCKDGISHSPVEDSDTRDAALAAGVILNAVRELAGS
jgi:allantoate deiminase